MKDKKKLHSGPEIKRLIFEYEDGTIKYLEDNAAKAGKIFQQTYNT